MSLLAPCVDSLSSRKQSERDSIFGRDSYERKLSNHHDQERRQGATAIIKKFLRNAHVKKFRRGQGAPSSKGGTCATALWHNGQSKPAWTPRLCHPIFRKIASISREDVAYSLYTRKRLEVTHEIILTCSTWSTVYDHFIWHAVTWKIAYCTNMSHCLFVSDIWVSCSQQWHKTYYINLYSPFNMVETTTKKNQTKNIHSKLLHTMTVI